MLMAFFFSFHLFRFFLSDEVSDYSSTDVDSSTQLYLKLNFFQGGGEEHFVCASLVDLVLLHHQFISSHLISSFFVVLFRSNYVKYNSTISEEQAWLLLTNVGVYILAQKKKPTEHLRGFTLLAEHPLVKVKKIQVGLFYQFFR